jgi:outer membrane protein assembly factor BamB
MAYAVRQESDVIPESRTLSGRLVVKHRLLSIIVMASVLSGAACHRKNSAQPGTILWSVQVGQGWSCPAVGLDGTVYVGNDAGTLTAVTPQGVVKWRASAGEPMRSPAIGPNGDIYVGAGTMLRAYSESGTELWTHETQGVILGSPAIGADGAVYIASNDGSLYALNADGSLLWQVSDCGSRFCLAIGTDGTIYVCCDDSGVVAISPNGSREWSCRPAGDPSSAPSIGHDGTIYAAMSGEYGDCIWALNPDGQPCQSHDYFYEEVTDAPAVGPDGTFYYSFSEIEDRQGWPCARAVRPDGRQRWLFFAEGDDEAVFSPAVGSNGMVYLTGDSDWFYAINQDGVADWQVPLEGTGPAPTLADGVAYALDAHGVLWAIVIDGGPADGLWPMSMHDAQHTCRAR